MWCRNEIKDYTVTDLYMQLLLDTCHVLASVI